MPSARRGGERLLAEDVAAGGDGLAGQRGVGTGRRRDGDGHRPRGPQARRATRSSARGTSKRRARSAVFSGSRPTRASTSKPACAQGAHMGVAAEARSRPRRPVTGVSGAPQPSTAASRRRVALGRHPAASVGPAPMEVVGEHLDADRTLRAPIAECRQIADEVEGTLAREQAIVQGGVDEVLLRLRRAVVELDGQDALPGYPGGRRGSCRARAQCHVSTLSPPLGRSASGTIWSAVSRSDTLDHASHSRWTSSPCSRGPVAQRGECRGRFVDCPSRPPMTSAALTDRAPRTSPMRNNSIVAEAEDADRVELGRDGDVGRARASTTMRGRARPRPGRGRRARQRGQRRCGPPAGAVVVAAPQRNGREPGGRAASSRSRNGRVRGKRARAQHEVAGVRASTRARRSRPRRRPRRGEAHCGDTVAGCRRTSRWSPCRSRASSS